MQQSDVDDQAVSHESPVALSATNREEVTETIPSSIPHSTPTTTFSSPPNNSYEGELALEYGRAAVEAGDLSKAERLFAKSVRLHPTTEAHQELARIQRRRKELEGSRNANQPSNRSQMNSSPSTSAAAASFSSSSSSSTAASSSATHVNHSPSARAESPPPRPSPPPFEPPPHAPAAAGPADAPGGGGLLNSITWRRSSFESPAFLASRVNWLRGRRFTYSYPAFFYVPPQQRRSLAVVWGIVSLLCVLRLLGWLNPHPHSFGPYHEHARRSARDSPDVGDGSPSTTHPGRTWTSTAYSTTSRVGTTLINFHNFMSLLPFLFFFIGPILHRAWIQRQAAAQDQAAHAPHHHPHHQ